MVSVYLRRLLVDQPVAENWLYYFSIPAVREGGIFDERIDANHYDLDIKVSLKGGNSDLVDGGARSETRYL
jgi:hypothetical protein